MASPDHQSTPFEDLVTTQPLDFTELMLRPSWPMSYVQVRHAEFADVQARAGRRLYRGRHHQPKGGTSK